MKTKERSRLFKFVLSFVLASTVIMAAGIPSAQKAYAGYGVPTAVNGRILTPKDTGDKVNWVEIARYGNYSLIVRSSYINWYSQINRYGDYTWQYVPYQGTPNSNSYSSSYARTYINKWFNGTGFMSADNLPANARLRSYTMQNNASMVLGTASTLASQTNGFSTPSTCQVGRGDDVAFALSFSEVMNFVSKTHDQRGRNPQVAPSCAIAQANYAKICIPQTWVYGMWTRSQGDTGGTAGALDYTGRAFQFVYNGTNEHGMLYPALWVDAGIFAPAIGTVDVVHKDADTGAVLQSERYEINTNVTTSYGPYPAKDIRFYQAGVLASYSDPASGTIAQGQTKTITYLYTRGQAMIFVLYMDVTNSSTIRSNFYVVPAGEYGPYNPAQINNYRYVGMASYSDAPSGVVDISQTKVIVFNYERMGS